MDNVHMHVAKYSKADSDSNNLGHFSLGHMGLSVSKNYIL